MALGGRLGTLPETDLRSMASPVAALALGALGGAWIGASWASRITPERLERLIFALTVETLTLTVQRQGVLTRWAKNRHGQ